MFEPLAFPIEHSSEPGSDLGVERYAYFDTRGLFDDSLSKLRDGLSRIPLELRYQLPLLAGPKFREGRRELLQQSRPLIVDRAACLCQVPVHGPARNRLHDHVRVDEAQCGWSGVVLQTLLTIERLLLRQDMRFAV